MALLRPSSMAKKVLVESYLAFATKNNECKWEPLCSKFDELKLTLATPLDCSHF